CGLLCCSPESLVLLKIQRTRRSTLFPYTTLFRSKSARLSGSLSFNRYPFRHSTTIAGSLPCNRVLYIPTACTIFLGTQICMPLKELSISPIGDPLCQIPSSLCPRALTISGTICLPTLLQCTAAASSLKG